MNSETALVVSPVPELQPAPLFSPTPKAAKRVLEFFTAQINNDRTCKAYLNATRRFAEWCDGRGVAQLADVQPFHVAAFIKHLQGKFAPPTVKQHLAALRMLFDWLVTGHVLDVNPAHAVHGPKYVVKKGKTPVLTADPRLRAPTRGKPCPPLPHPCRHGATGSRLWRARWQAPSAPLPTLRVTPIDRNPLQFL